MSHHSRDNSSDDDDGDSLCLEDILHEKLERIAILERSYEVQGKHMEAYQQQLTENEVKHKEEVYWLQLELDKTRREKDASEERMAELCKDFADMMKEKKELQHHQQQEQSYPERSQKISGSSPTSLTTDFQTKAEHYERMLGIMDNQVSMVKTSCDEVVKTLKEEISDLMEDRCRMEIDLLNQLASLDREKKESQMEYVHRLKLKDETLQRVRDNSKRSSSSYIAGAELVSSNDEFDDNGHENNNRQCSSNYYSQDDMDELEDEIGQLRLANGNLQNVLEQERLEAEETIVRLEDVNVKLESKLESMTEELAVMRMPPKVSQIVEALDRTTSERREVIDTLEQVANISDRADASVKLLKDVMDKLRPTNDKKEVGEDRELLMTTLENASLVHGQVKVSLLLIEVKLRNQLNVLKNVKTTAVREAPGDAEVRAQLTDVRHEALAALNQAESILSRRIQDLEDRSSEERESMQRALRDRTEALESMQTKHKKLEEEMERLQRQGSMPSGNVSKANGKETKRVGGMDSLPENDEKPMLLGISATALDDLQQEVLGVIERIQVKNSIIKTLQQELGEFASREKVLKKELKRAFRRQQKLEEQQLQNPYQGRQGKDKGRGGTTRVVLTKLSKKRPPFKPASPTKPIKLSPKPNSTGKAQVESLPSPLRDTTTSSEPKASLNTTLSQDLQPIGTQISDMEHMEYPPLKAVTMTVRKPEKATTTESIIAPLQPSPRELTNKKSFHYLPKLGPDITAPTPQS